MREMTATEASRNFSSLLDAAEHGESVVVTRSGRRIAEVRPASAANGHALRDVFARWRDDPALDDTFEDRVAHARQAATGADTDPWRD